MKISSYEALLVGSILENVYGERNKDATDNNQWGFGFASEDHEALKALRQRLEDEDFGEGD